MESNQDLVLRDVKEGIGTIRLNRTEALNAFNLALSIQLLEAVEAMGEDPTVRVIVLRGKGRCFSVGGDAREMMGYVEKGEDRAAYFREPLGYFHRVILGIRNCPKPVLAAVHGAVAGYAFNLVLSCDLRIAVEGTRFLQAFIKLGLTPDGGGTWVLPRLVGYARACELTMLPGEIDAERAREWGLINWTVDE